MAVRPIRIWPDPALSEVAKPVEAVDDGVRQLIADLFDTMYDANGVGLAANQVGIGRRILVIDLDPKNHAKQDPEVRADLEAWNYTGPVALVNPRIVSTKGSIVWDEGCLSVPGITEEVKRADTVQVEYLDRKGRAQSRTAHGLFAVAIQHELDHLNGKVFVEYLSRLKRDVIRRKMQRLKGGDTAAAAR